MSDSVIIQLLAKEIPATLFHYTSAAGLIGILDSGKIWATKIHYLNDNSELQLALEYFYDEIKQQKKGIERTRTDQELDDMKVALESSATTNVSVISFTEMGDQLSQWRGYCEIGKGYSVGLDGSKLRRFVKKKGYALHPCVYEVDMHRRIVKDLIANFSLTKSLTDFDITISPPYRPIHTFSSEALFLAPLIKSASFQEEREWRLVTPLLSFNNAEFRAGNHSIIPYWEVDMDLTNTLKTIIVGPTPEPDLSVTAVSGLIMKKLPTLYEIKISPSKIPFRKI